MSANIMTNGSVDGICYNWMVSRIILLELAVIWPPPAQSDATDRKTGGGGLEGGGEEDKEREVENKVYIITVRSILSKNIVY